jgi:hypothetical protein
MPDETRLLKDGLAESQDREMGDPVHPILLSELRLRFDVHLEHHGAARHIASRLGNLRRRTPARTAPTGPEIHEHRHVHGLYYLAKLSRIHLDGFSERGQRIAALSATANVSETLTRDTVALPTAGACSDHGMLRGGRPGHLGQYVSGHPSAKGDEHIHHPSRFGRRAVMT